MNQNQHIQIRISEEEKEVAREIFESMGLTFSGAIKLFLKKTIQERKMPFHITAHALVRRPVRKETRTVPLEKPVQKEHTATAWTSFEKRKIGS